MTKKYYFVLRNIDPIEIDNKYSFYVSEKMTLMKEDVGVKKTDRTKIADLSTKTHDQQTFSYLDESKKEHQCILTMMNQEDHQYLPDKTLHRCFWCHHAFDVRPIGCPLQYIPHRIIKHYYSEITKDNYTLRENISTCQLTLHEKMYAENKMDMTSRDFYMTDGMFCSFNCCLAFIMDQHADPIYTYSEQLLNTIYTDLFGKDAQPIVPAPSWRILKEYGGHLTIEEFRKNFYKVEYKDIDNIVYPFSKFRPVGFLFEKQVRI